MVQYIKANIQLSYSELNKLKSAAKSQTGVTLRINIKMFHGNNLPHELLLTTRKKKLRNTFENNIKLSKAQISKIIQPGGILGSLLSKIAGWLMKVAVPLAKSILVLLEITAAALTIYTGIQIKKTWFWSPFRLCFGKNYFKNFKQRNGCHNENWSNY